MFRISYALEKLRTHKNNGLEACQFLGLEIKSRQGEGYIFKKMNAGHLTRYRVHLRSHGSRD
jgi:hypothetical protein